MAGGVVRALPGWISAGVVVQIGAAAGVQFAGGRGFAFRVIRPQDWATCTGHVWLDGYQVNTAGAAVQRRSIFVLIDGLLPALGPYRRPSGTDAGPPL
ncbi:hypothetical protein AB0K00_42430 [Dactylosporangium sp. NPDC049525]|uniref:hypothetical protein n=1 Tax=Dactylosporangium sp. NPDC049525 TaxID=3154730 RepID=UPI003427DDA0